MNNKINDVHIVTVATESKYYFDYLKKTCSQNGIELTVLGFGEKWKGFAWRLQLMISYLKKLKPNDIVCFVDGYDVICIRDLKELKKVFEKIVMEKKCKIIVGKDASNLGFLATSLLIAGFGTCNNQNINAGTYIGYAKDLIEILNSVYNIKPELTSDDQILLTKFCNIKPDYFYVDVNNEIFVVLANKFGQIDNYIDVKDNKNYYKNSRPFFIHGPGSTLFDKTLIKLNYCSDNDTEKLQKIYDDLQKDSAGKEFGLIIHSIKERKETIFFIILIIIFIILMFKKYKNKT
jgi:hypothetical protein